MDVLFINRCLTGGGSEKAMVLIANYLAKMGKKVGMLLLVKDKETYCLDPEIEVIECFCPMGKNKIVWHFKRICMIRKVLKEVDARHVVSFMWDINVRVILANLGLHKRIVCSERADPRNETRKFINFALKYILPLADFTVFQTPIVQSYYPLKAQRKSIVIPNAIGNMPRCVDYDKRKKVIVAIGRLAEQKNYELLIETFKKFHEVHQEYKLIIYGEGVLRNRVEALISKLNLNTDVELLGYVSNIPERIADAQMYINTSNYEGISNAMLEALAMGLPCVCTDCPVGGAAMVIKDHHNGILVEVGNQQELLTAMLEIAEDDMLAKKLSANATQVRIDYSVEKIGARWAEVIFKEG